MNRATTTDERRGALVRALYERMLAAAGPRRWWPRRHDGPRAGTDEIVIGAVLTQNTAWSNVEKALAELVSAGMLDLTVLATRDVEAIAPRIRASGYFNLKARRLKAVAQFFAPGGKPRFDDLARWGDAALRAALLATYGVGPETADSILLYALGRPTFVIDAYTLRVAKRHGLIGEAAGYEAARALFMRHAAPEVAHYNEYHALLVWIGHHYCKPTPRCAGCPLAAPELCATKKAWRGVERRVRAAGSG